MTPFILNRLERVDACQIVSTAAKTNVAINQFCSRSLAL